MLHLLASMKERRKGGTTCKLLTVSIAGSGHRANCTDIKQGWVEAGFAAAASREKLLGGVARQLW